MLPGANQQQRGLTPHAGSRRETVALFLHSPSLVQELRVSGPSQQDISRIDASVQSVWPLVFAKHILTSQAMVSEEQDTKHVDDLALRPRLGTRPQTKRPQRWKRRAPECLHARQRQRTSSLLAQVALLDNTQGEVAAQQLGLTRYDGSKLYTVPTGLRARVQQMVR